MTVKLPADEFIEARVVSRAMSIHTESSGYTKGTVVLLVESDGVLAAIKGFAWAVPEMAVAPEKSTVRFRISTTGAVSEMQILELAKPETSQDDS